MKFGSARPVCLPVQAVLFAELADFYYYFLCKRVSVSLLTRLGVSGSMPCLLPCSPGIPHTLCKHTKAWPQGSERPGHPCLPWSPAMGSSHPFAWDVSLCSLLLPGLRPVLGVGSGLDLGETRQAWGPC